MTVTGWDLPVDGAGASAELYVHSLPADARRTADAVDVLGTADGTAASLAQDGSLPYEVRPLAVGDTFSVPCGKEDRTARRDDLYLQVTGGPAGASVATVTVHYRDGWFEHSAVGHWETGVCPTDTVPGAC